MTKKTTEHPEGLPLALKQLPVAEPRKMRHFWQGAGEYGRDLVGDGTSSMAAAGCLVSSLDMIGIYLGAIDATVNPGEANRRMKKIPGAFSGSNLVMHLGARALGLEAPASERIKSAFGDPRLKKLLISTLEAGDCAVVHVSTDGDPKDGGEHFIAAYRIEGDDVVCADSALGAPVHIPLATLEKRVMWRNKEKIYQIVSVAPVRKASA